MITSRVKIKGVNDTDAAFRKVFGNIDRLDRVSKKVSGGAGGFAGGVVVAGLGAIAKRSLDAADNVQKLSLETKLSARFLSEMSHVASLGGTSLNAVTNASSKLGKSLEDARNGLSTAKRGFSALNIDVEAFRKLTPDQQFEAFADAISKVPDQSKRTQIAMDLMGRSGKEMLRIMSEGSGPIRELREEAKRMGLSLSKEAVDGAASANDAMERLSSSFKAGVMTTVLAFSDDIKNLADWMREKIPEAARAASGAFSIIKEAIVPVVTTFLAVKAAMVVIPALAAATTTLSVAFAGMSAKALLATAATGSLGAAAGLLKGAMALLGGPAGVIALAVGALVLFSSNARVAKNENNKLVDSILRSANISDAAGQLKNINGEYDRLGKEIAQVRAELENRSAWDSARDLAGNLQHKLNVLVSRQKDAKKAASILTEEMKRQAKEKETLNAKLSDLNGRMSSSAGIYGKFKNAAEELNAILKKNADKTKRLEGLQAELNQRFPEGTRGSKEYIKALEAIGVKVEKVSGIYGKFKSAAAEVDHILSENSKKSDRLKGILGELNKRFPVAERASKAYKDALAAAGIQTEKLGTKSQTMTELIIQGWRKFQDSTQDIFFNFVRNGGNIFRKFKDLIFDILAQIAAKIATTFAIEKLTGLLDGTKLGSLLGIDKLGLDAGDTLGQGIKSGLSTALSGTKLGSLLGLGGLNAAAATTVASGGGVGVTAAMGQLLSSGSAAPASGGFFAGLSKILSSKIIPALAKIAPPALAIAAVLGVAKTGLGKAFGKIFDIFGGGKTPQEKAEDQLRLIDEKTRSGQHEQVRLGFAGDTAVSFIGGNSEREVFFGIDQGKAELQTLGKLLQDHYNFRGHLAVKDGILRLELNQDFSQSHEEVVAKVKAGIVEIQLGLTNSERQVLSGLGSAVSAMDRLFDQSAKTGKSTAVRIREAYAGAFGVSQEAAMEALQNIGISAERMGQIFDVTSNEVLDTMLNIATHGEHSAQIIEGAFANTRLGITADLNGLITEFGAAREQIEGSWAGLNLGDIKPIQVPPIDVPDQAANSQSSAGSSGQPSSQAQAGTVAQVSADVRVLAQTVNQLIERGQLDRARTQPLSSSG